MYKEMVKLRGGRRLLAWLLSLSMMVAMLPTASVRAAESEESAGDADCSVVGHQFVGERCNRCGAVEKRKPEGDGTAASPYQIGKVSELYWFAGLVNGDQEVCTGDVTQNKKACAVLTADITVNAGVLDHEGNLTTHTEGLLEWTPIGNSKAIYDLKATFDGQGHCIRGLYCNQPDTNYVGLFGYTKGKIKNVGVEDVYMAGKQWVGGIFGSAPGGSVSNCYAIGTMAGEKNVGGLGGSIANTISGSYSIARSAGTGSGLPMGGNFSAKSKFDQCYYGPEVCSDSEKDGITYASSEEFASGKVAYQLQQASAGLTAWGQDLADGGDTHPVFDRNGSRQVYQTKGCVTYSNDPNDQGRDKKHATPENGICPDCGELVKESEGKSVSYLNEQGETQLAENVQDVEDTTIEWKGTDTAPAWYVVEGTVLVKERITVSGKVHLILADGSSLEAEQGIHVAEGNSLTIHAQSTGDNAGTLVATGDDRAGIGGGREEAGGEITIMGGNITATADGGAGIGGGYSGAGGEITIYGGNVIATGEAGAGIGGGRSGASGKITICGGTVIATGGGNKVGGGAGIGGGWEGAGIDITIHGGNITATGKDYGAGIGGGYGGAGGKITICGGIVTAVSDGEGKRKGAGIGGGYTGDAGTFQTQMDEESASKGTAIIFATSISDTSGSWNGLIAYGEQGGLYGTMTEAVIEESITIPTGRKLTIGDGRTLTIKQGATFTNNGALEVESGGRLVNQGTATNNNTLEIRSGGSLINRGILTNNGTLTVASGGSFDNSEGTFKQSGTYNDQNGESAGETPGTVQKCLTISDITVADKAYDGMATLKVTGAALKGMDEGDEVLVQVDELSAVLDSSRAGTYQQIKSLAGNVILTGKDAEKYYVDLTCDSNLSVNAGKGVTITKNTEEITKTVADKSYLSIADHSDTIYISRLFEEDLGEPENISVTTVKVLDEEGTDIQATEQWTASMDSDYRLNYTTKAGEPGKRKLVVVLETQNYSHIELTVDITLVPCYKVQVKEGSKVTTNPDGITYGQSLAELAFEDTIFTDEKGNVVPGTLSWKDPSYEPKGSETTAECIFTPQNNAYAVLEEKATITVHKQEPQITEVPVAENELTYGQKLSEAVLTGGGAVNVKKENMAGTFVWKDLDQIPTAVDSGKAQYTVIFQPEDTENYKESETKIAVTVKKADIAPDVPETAMTVPYTTKTVEKVSLPKNWQWQSDESGKESLLEVGVPFEATAVYVGSDKGNYEIESATVTITRSACTHETTELRNVKNATCTQDGYSGDTYCTICDTKLASGEAIKAAGHKLTKVEAKEATATEAGNRAYFKCDICGEYFEDGEGKVAITDKNSVVIPAKGTTSTKLTGPKAVGTVITEDKSGVTYKVTSSDPKKPEVEYKTPKNKKETKVVIPDTVTIDGVEYAVTSIAKNAFKNNKKLTEVKIGKNVTSIGDNAFAGCKNLRKVELNENLTTIGKNAFKNCKRLKTITIKSTKLNKKNVKKGAFKGITAKTVIKVPKSKFAAYKKLFWSKGLSKKVRFKKY